MQTCASARSGPRLIAGLASTVISGFVVDIGGSSLTCGTLPHASRGRNGPISPAALRRPVDFPSIAAHLPPEHCARVAGAALREAFPSEGRNDQRRNSAPRPPAVRFRRRDMIPETARQRFCDAPRLPRAMRRKRVGNGSNIEKRHRALVALGLTVSVQAKSEGSRTSRLTASPAVTGCAPIGNCNTIARWPSHRRVSSTTCPSGNSSAS